MGRGLRNTRDDSPANTHRAAEIAGAQQDILREVFETDDLSDVPQLWCLYKEVQSYYLDGVSWLGSSHRLSYGLGGSPLTQFAAPSPRGSHYHDGRRQLG
jgi:hypothetical protein